MKSFIVRNSIGITKARGAWYISRGDTHASLSRYKRERTDESNFIRSSIREKKPSMSRQLNNNPTEETPQSETRARGRLPKKFHLDTAQATPIWAATTNARIPMAGQQGRRAKPSAASAPSPRTRTARKYLSQPTYLSPSAVHCAALIRNLNRIRDLRRSFEKARDLGGASAHL